MQHVQDGGGVVHYHGAVIVGLEEHFDQVGKFGIVVGHHHGLLAPGGGGGGLVQQGLERLEVYRLGEVAAHFGRGAGDNARVGGLRENYYLLAFGGRVSPEVADEIQGVEGLDEDI